MIDAILEDKDFAVDTKINYCSPIDVIALENGNEDGLTKTLKDNYNDVDEINMSLYY